VQQVFIPMKHVTER